MQLSAAVQLFTCITSTAEVAQSIQVFRYDPTCWNREIGVLFSAGAKDISVLHSVHTGCGATVLFSGCCWYSARAVSQNDHTPSYSAEVQNEWSYTATPLYAVMTCTGSSLLLLLLLSSSSSPIFGESCDRNWVCRSLCNGDTVCLLRGRTELCVG